MDDEDNDNITHIDGQFCNVIMFNCFNSCDYCICIVTYIYMHWFYNNNYVSSTACNYTVRMYDSYLFINTYVLTNVHIYYTI